MALSNWDTLSAGFVVVEEHVREGDSRETEAMRRASAAVQAHLQRVKDAHDRGEDTSSLIAEIMASGAYGQACRDEREARSVRTVTADACDSFGADGWSAEIYKNWCYLRVGGAAGPVTVHEGAMDLPGGGELHASRGPQESVFVAAFTRAQDQENPAVTSWRGILGCGAYAFMLPDGSSCEDPAGVHPDTAAALSEWAAGVQPFLAAVPLEAAPRFNQGDRFIAGAFGVPVPQSAPGAAEPTLISDAIRGLSGGPGPAGLS